jgi:hypothetical protein
MPDPSPESRGKIPPRIAALFRRKWSWKDVALILLALSFVSMSAYAFRAPIAEAFARFRAGAQGGETVSVFDVVVDREGRQHFDVLFDKPLGQGKVGEVLDPAPASISPPDRLQGAGSGGQGEGGLPRRDAVQLPGQSRGAGLNGDGEIVARLESVLGESGDPEGRLARLERQGLLRRASTPLPREVLMRKPPRPCRGASVLEALLAERRDSR